MNIYIPLPDSTASLMSQPLPNPMPRPSRNMAVPVRDMHIIEKRFLVTTTSRAVSISTTLGRDGGVVNPREVPFIGELALRRPCKKKMAQQPHLSHFFWNKFDRDHHWRDGIGLKTDSKSRVLVTQHVESVTQVTMGCGASRVVQTVPTIPVQYEQAMNKLIERQWQLSSELAIAKGHLSRDDALCTICMEETVSVVLVPCGHLCLCESCCGRHITSSQQCPICRENISMATRVYFPTAVPNRSDRKPPVDLYSTI